MCKKLRLSFIFVLSFVFLFSACKKKTGEVIETVNEESDALSKALDAKKTSVSLGFVPGPEALPFVYFFDNETQSNSFNLKTHFFTDKENLLSSLLKNQINAAVFSLSEVHRILSSMPDCALIAGSSGRNRIFLLSDDIDFSELSALKNKTVYAGVENSFENYLFNSVLQKKGLSSGEGEGKVHPDYSVTLSSVSSRLSDGFYSYSVSGEPFCSISLSKNPSLSKVLDLTAEYDSLNEGFTYPEFIVLVNSDYAKKYSSAVSFIITKFNSAVNYLNENPHKCAESAVKNHLFVTKKTALCVIENCDFFWRNNDEIRPAAGRFFENAGLEKLPDSAYFSF